MSDITKEERKMIGDFIKKVVFGIVLFVGLIMSISSFYIQQEYQTSLVTRFGEVKNIVKTSGFHIKAPFIDNLTKYETKYQPYYSDTSTVITLDRQTIDIDIIGAYHIVDPLQFYITGRTFDRISVRLDDTIYSTMLATVSKYTFSQIINKNRETILNIIKDKANEEVKSFGVEVDTLQFMRVLPVLENEKNIHLTMISERKRASEKLRSEGDAKYNIMKSEADLNASKIRAEAIEKASKIKADADKKAQELINNAINNNSELYAYMKNLDMIKNGIKDGTKLIIPTNNNVFENLIKP